MDQNGGLEQVKVSKFGRFSKVQMYLFIAIFAAVGFFLIWHSFAATPTKLVASVEAESVSPIPSGGLVVPDTAASGGSALQLTTHSVIQSSVNLPADVISVGVKAKSNTCQSAFADFDVAIDGKYLTKTTASNTAWTEYTLPTTIKTGSHTVVVSVDNNSLVSAGCDKYITIDAVNFYADATVTSTAPPVVTISASPNPVVGGENATIAWSATNNPNTCTSSGDWPATNLKSPASPTTVATPVRVNWQTKSSFVYTLTCTNNYGSGTATATLTTTFAPVATALPAWTTPTCLRTITPNTNLATVINDTSTGASTNNVICLQDGNYTLSGSLRNATVTTGGLKLWAIHQYQAKIKGAADVYIPGLEFHGVSLNNAGTQTMQVYADNFVFIDSIFTNGHQAGGFYLGSATYGIAHNVKIQRNKIYSIGKLPGGPNGDHAIYVDNAQGQINDNWMWDNTGYGLLLYPNAYGIIFSNNIIDKQQVAGVMFGSTGAGTSVSANIIANTPIGVTSCCVTHVNSSAAQGGVMWNVASPFQGYNDSSQPARPTLTTYYFDPVLYATIGYNGDPMFTDYANHNYNLTHNSPANSIGGARFILPTAY